MTPASFDYVAPEAHDEVMRLLESNQNAVLLAGGHSLLTALKQRSLRTSLVIDIAGLGLDAIAVNEDGDLRIEASATQARLADFCGKDCWPIFSEIGLKAGDPMIRNRGTFVGALCAAEPGGDWAAAALALDVDLLLSTSAGEQRLPYADYLAGAATGPHLVLCALVPAKHRTSVQGYEKVKHAGIGWSVASVAFITNGKKLQLAASGALLRPARLSSVEHELESIAEHADIVSAIGPALDGLDYAGDRYAPADWRRVRLAILIRDIVRRHTSEETA